MSSLNLQKYRLWGRIVLFCLIISVLYSSDGGVVHGFAEMSIVYVAVQLSAGYPVQVFVDVTGEVGGCTEHYQTYQRREGNTITIKIITITTIGEGVGCRDFARVYQETVAIGTLPPGDYQVSVNGVEQQFRID